MIAEKAFVAVPTELELDWDTGTVFVRKRSMAFPEGTEQRDLFDLLSRIDWEFVEVAEE